MPVLQPRRFAIRLAAACAFAACATSAFAQDTIKVANIQELSGTGATAGTNFKNGVELAIKEINAAGGIMGKKIESSISDTQSNPGVAKAMATKAVDNGVIAVFGPGFSGSMIVSMGETRRAETPNFTGAEATAITAQGNPYVFRTSFSQVNAMPKLARYVAANLKAKTIAVIFGNNDFGKGGCDAKACIAVAAQGDPDRVKSALKMADEAIALESGRLVLHKRASELLADPNIERLFLGGAHAAAPVSV
jgi:branched-chain amino acid transport system substrate-binding protein